MLYDSRAYDIPEAENGILTLRTASDVDKLNELFYLNAYNNVFLNQKIKESYIERIHNKNKQSPKIKELEREVTSFASVDSNNTLVSFTQNRVPKNINFSWIKNSKFANNFVIPSHIGGIHRTESPYIIKFLEKNRLSLRRIHRHLQKDISE